METLYHQTNGLIQRTQNGFAVLERATAAEAGDRERELNSAIDNIVSNCKRLDILSDKEPVQRRHSAKQRVDQLKYECQHLQSALRALQHRRMARERERLDREELLTQRFTTNDQSDTSIAIDAALQMNDRLQSSSRGMDNLLDMGNSVLTNLRDQRSVLKGARRRMLDLFNSCGMSYTVMRLTERRAGQNKFIPFGGCAGIATQFGSSSRGMDNLLDMGNSVLTNLRDHGSVLKGARRRMLDLFNTFGMSYTVMRLTECRAGQDKFILFGGMLVTMVIMYVTCRYLTRGWPLCADY